MPTAAMRMKPSRKLIALIIIAVVLFSATLYLRSSSAAAGGGTWQGGQWFLPIVTAAALVDSINPCAFSVLLLTIAFLFSLGRLRRNILATGSLYIAGLFAVYVLIGLGILRALLLFNTPHVMASVGATLLILWGVLTAVNELFPSFPIKLKIPESVHRPMAKLMEQASLPAAFLLGGLVGFFEFPCTGGPYLFVLGLLHDQETYLKGLAYLAYYNLIFVLPLIVILAIASNEALLERAQTWRREHAREMRLWTGAAMALLGGLMFLL